jgi:hypothetical protein
MRAFPFSTSRLLAIAAAVALCGSFLAAQQTLGGITGEVTDASGGVIPNATVSLTHEETSVTRTTRTNGSGTYTFVNLPIGTYTLTYTADGYQAQRTPHITVEADRTATVNASLKVGQTTTTVEVEAAPLMNAVDTTNGYVMETQQIDSVPLPTGSFTGLAILSPGVNAELGGGTGSNSGLGNAPIWANGQRDTSNAFLVNGVDASNLFNGKSTSQVDSFRVVNNTGQANNAAGGVIPSAASVYLAIGNAIPTPAPETIAEVRVNASMYDAQQGSDSGAHIDMSTKSGTNKLHGELYGHRETNWINAAPFFFKKDDNIPASDKNPDLHRYIAGGDLGGPLIKNKLFGFVSYQHLHIADQETGDELLDVPPGMNSGPMGSGTGRSVANLTESAENNWTSNIGYQQFSGFDPTYGGTFNNFGPAGNPLAYALLTAPALPGEPGNYLVPSALANADPNIYSPYNAFLPGTSRFTSDQAVANLDWNVGAKDILALKYYYQHDPSSSPYAYSNVPGFTAHMDTGAQVGSINNVQTIGSNLSISETVGILREKTYATNDQPWAPGQANTPAAGMTSSFGGYFPGFTINDAIGDAYDSSTGPLYGGVAPSLSIGPDAEYQAENTGVFQNRIMPSGTAIWAKGRHNVAFGGSWSYTQLNLRDRRTGTGSVASPDYVAFLDNWVTPYSTQNFTASTYLQGNADRYLRANETGLFVQDKFQAMPNLSITLGLRWDWNGGLWDKNGDLFNFDSSQYKYDPLNDVIDSSGFIIAGNNKNGTSGVSKTTLTGRQWGIAPRLGIAWQPSMFHSKLVVRSGGGFYYDRGELFTYLSPGFAAGEVEAGPFGIMQTPPFVTQQHCPYSSSFQAADPTFLYLNYIPICGGDDFTPPSGGDYTLAAPWGPTLGPGPSNPKASDIANYLPNAAAIVDGTVTGSNSGQPFILGVYNRANKLPYSINFTLNLQYQPRNDLMVEVGYVGNLGRHQVIPIPFNQAQIATPGHPIHPGGKALQGGTSVEQDYSYGYTVYDPSVFYPICVNLDPTCHFGPMMNNYEGGNVDLRVPYIGYSSESESYTAAGIAAYHALESHVEKRLSHGFQAGVSYTFSHATDEQSGLGLFYNGNNPTNLRSGYGSADFDRTHVLNFTYGYTTPKFLSMGTLAGKLLDSWGLHGIAVIQSGQPYSIIDYSGAVGSIFYSTFNGITNPIVPLNTAAGCTRKNALTGQNGAFYNPLDHSGAALKASCFTLPLIPVGTMGVPAGDPYETNFTSGQRNIFRQGWQRRVDASLAKEVPIHEQYTLRYTFDVFNITNTASFDIPQNNVNQNQAFNNVPTIGTPAAPTNDCQGDPTGANSGFFNCPGGLGITKHTIGSPREIQMSLDFSF